MMRAFRSSTLATALAGAVLFGSVGVAFASADDGGAEAFFDKTGPGSARGVVAPDAGVAAPIAGETGDQPHASVSRTGVAQAVSHRQVAVTRMGHRSVAALTRPERLTVAHRAAPSPREVADHAAAPRRIQHALHRDLEREPHQS